MNTPLRAVPQAFAHVRRFIFANRDKVPCDFYGNPCDPHNPAKWLTPAELKSSPLYFDPRYFIGFVFARGDRRFGIDLDKCFDAAGMITPAAAAVLERFPGAYVEVSISGTGLHIIGTGEAPPHRTRAPGLELYTEGRYFLLTGSQARGDAGLDFTPALGAFVDAYGLHRSPDDVGAVAIPDDGPRPGSTGVQYPDSELIAIMLAAGGGAALRMGEKAHPRDLWHANAEALARYWPQSGRRDGCPFDRSAAEAALFMHLSWYTGGHVSRMIALFKQSALYREGMDDAELWRKHSVPICKAAAGMKFFDQPRALPGLPAPGGMVMPVAPLALTVLADDDILPEEEPEYIRGMLPATPGYLTFLAGQSQAGKSFAACRLSVALAIGGDFMGRMVTERTGVVIVAAEGAGGYRARLWAVKRELGLIGHKLNIVVIPWRGDLKDPYVCGALVETVKSLSFKVGAIIIDTLPAAFQLVDNNDGSEATAVCNQMRSIGERCSSVVVPIHHLGKDKSRGIVGSQAWFANADYVISCDADIDPLTGEVLSRHVAIIKSREGVTGPVCSTRLRVVDLGPSRYPGETRTTCIYERDIRPHVETSRDKNTLAPEIIDKVRAHLTMHGTRYKWSANVTGDGFKPALELIMGETLKRDRYERIMLNLEEAGIVRKIAIYDGKHRPYYVELIS